MKRKKTWGIAIVLLAAAFAGYRWFGRPPAVSVSRWAVVERGDLEIVISATGVVQPRNRLEIKPPIAGRLEDILVREGGFARKGQVLAWMSSTERAALLDASRAKGPEEVAHWEQLYRPTPLMAPLDGVVIDCAVEPGQTVNGQEVLFVMSDRLIVKAQVDETDIGRVKVGQQTRVSLDAYPDEPIPGEVEHIAFEAKTLNNVTIYEVDVLPESVPDFMRSGMTANVVFTVARKKDALLVPADAVQSEDGRSVVLMPAPDGGERPVAKEVETGLSDGKRAEIVLGLEEGDKVLVRSVRIPAALKVQSSPFSPFGGGQRQGQNRRDGGRR